MKHKRNILVILFLITLFSFTYNINESLQMPKTWDSNEIKKFMLPLADTTVTVTEISEDYYYKLPEMKIFKSYPIRITDEQTNKKYIDSLKSLDPVDYFKSIPANEKNLVLLGEKVFNAPIEILNYSEEFYKELNRDIKNANVLLAGNVFPYYTYLIDEKSQVKVGIFSCATCHTRVMKDGSTITGAQGTFPIDRMTGQVLEDGLKNRSEEEQESFNKDIRKHRQRFQKAPWIKHQSQLELDSINSTKIAQYLKAIPDGVMIRHGSNFNQPTSIPDLRGIKDRKYFDHTGLMIHRGIGDLMRYAAFNQNADMLTRYNDFIPAGIYFKTLPEPGKGKFTGTNIRYSELQLFALAKYLYSLKPLKNPNLASAEILKKGEFVFKREGCVTCHTPPLYTNNKLTPVEGFSPPLSHFKKFDLFNASVETDPGLALYTRRGTGYYKVPSLLGVWYRGPFGHSGHVKTLEDWFDKKRIEDDYVPTGFKPAFTKTMAVKGHEFGLNISKAEKDALISFLKSL